MTHEFLTKTLREVAQTRIIHLCWTCDAQVNEYDARTQDLGWGVVSSGSNYEFWECPTCGADEGEDDGE